MKNQKSFLAGMLTMLLLVCMIGTVSAARSTLQIQVEYKDIKVVLDGKVLDLWDAAGNVTEPFKYGGTNYVPVRALSEALGLTVEWDGQTNTINLTSNTGAKEYRDGYLSAPASVYTSSAEENGMENVPMYVTGEVTEISEYNGCRYVVVATNLGKMAIIDTLQMDGFSSMGTGDSVTAGFYYTGYSAAIKMPCGVYAEILERKEVPKTPAAPVNPVKEEEEPPQVSRTVYVTKTGKRYHYSSSCNGGQYYASALSDALARGLTPCNKCVG